LKIFQTALDGFAMTVKKLSDVRDATVPEFEGLRCGIETTLSFIEGGKSKLHGLPDSAGVSGEHEGIPANWVTKKSLSRLPRLPLMPRAKKAKWDS
jgi:hypothetical protein